MNYLQMYINLSVFFGCLSIIFLVCFIAALDPKGGAKKGFKVSLGLVSTILVFITIFCAAMAGLLS